MVGTVLLIALKSFVLLAALLVFIAYALLADRKIWAAVQLRRGPNVVGPYGLFQSFADLLKFVLKEPVIPAGANKAIYLLAPLVFAMLALSSWAVMPIAPTAGPSPTSMSASPTSSRSRRSACTASSWAAGRRTRNTPSSARFARRRR